MCKTLKMFIKCAVIVFDYEVILPILLCVGIMYLDINLWCKITPGCPEALSIFPVFLNASMPNIPMAEIQWISFVNVLCTRY